MRASEEYNSLQMKQNYVYQNILEAQYDIEAFAQYLASQAPKYSSNLEELDYNTVKNAVDSFIQKHQKPRSKTSVNKQRESMSMSQSQIGHLSVDYGNMDFYSKSRQCVKQINKFALTSINVNVVSYKKNEGGFLSRGFITFRIELPQLHKQIDRRYSDFQWLRQVLEYFHPGVVIPPLPKKKMKKIFTQNHLKKKGKMLQNFLRKSLQVPDLRNDENMYRFLTIQKSDKFQEHKKQNKLEKGIVPLEKIKSATGTIQYGINMQSITINKKGIEYFRQLSPNMKQLYKQIKRVEQCLDTCSVHLQNLENVTKKLIPVEEEFRRDCAKGEIFKQEEQREKNFFQNLSFISEKYKYQLKAMRDVWEKQLYMKMKFEFHHSEAFVEAASNYQSVEKEYYNLKEYLKKKKLKNYARPINEWEITPQQKTRFLNQKPSFNEVAPFMMPKKTQQLAVVQMNYAILSSQMCNSISLYAKHNNLYNLKTLQTFLQKQHAVENTWADQLKNIITDQFQFTLVETKEKIANVGNSIKGFFSMYTGGEKKQGGGGFKSMMVDDKQKKIGIKEVSGITN